MPRESATDPVGKALPARSGAPRRVFPGDRPGWIGAWVDAPEGLQELVAAALVDTDALSVELDLPADPSAPEGWRRVRTAWPRDADSPARRAAVRARLADLGSRSGLSELADLDVRFEWIAPRDWIGAARDSFRAFRVGRIAVVPPWSAAPLRPGDRVLRLEPGGVFGSGRHGSTRLLLRALPDLVRPGERVLDAGTGSGILAVAALLLGAGEALGFDVDPVSRGYAEALARENAVEDRARFRTAGFEDLGAGDAPFDGVLANIYHDVLQAHAGTLAARLVPGGWFALSGIHARHLAPTRSAVLAAGLVPTREPRIGPWCALIGRRPGS